MEDKMKELTVLISKTDKAMEMTRNTQLEIDDMKDVLMEEVRPMMVEKRKEEIAQKESRKSEFDEMTKEAILRAKAEILQIREQAEKEYQDKLIENVEKQKRIADKLKSIEIKEQDEEKISMARNSAEKALANVKEEMKNHEKRYLTVIRPKLAEFETKIGDYAIELGIEEEFNKVGLEKEETENEKINEGKNESTNSKEEKVEQIKEEEQKNESVKGEEEKIELTKSEPIKTNNESQNNIAEEIFEEQYAYNDGFDENGRVEKDARIESIKFKFESGNPRYTIITKSGDILTANVNAENKKLYKPATEQIKAQINAELGFEGAYKLADPFLLKFLKDYDKANGTTEYGRYVQILRDGTKEKFAEEEPEMLIHYDMNGKESAKMDKESIKNLQKIAKRNQKYEIASYDKGKGWLARLIEKIKTPKLSAGNKDEVEKAEPEKETAHKEFVENLQKEAQKDTSEQSKTDKDSKDKVLFGGKEGKFSKTRQSAKTPQKEETMEFTIEEVKDEEVR